MKYNTLRGFTMLEVLLSVAALGIIAGIGIPVYQTFQVRNDLDISATAVAQSLRRAQVLAQGGAGDTSWGVAVASSSITIFKGTTYASRDVAYDELFNMPTSIVPSGSSEIVLGKMTGLPVAESSIVLTSNANEIRTITINSKGMVAY